jgi:hypothetical protein
MNLVFTQNTLKFFAECRGKLIGCSSDAWKLAPPTSISERSGDPSNVSIEV